MKIALHLIGSLEYMYTYFLWFINLLCMNEKTRTKLFYNLPSEGEQKSVEEKHWGYIILCKSIISSSFHDKCRTFDAAHS